MDHSEKPKKSKLFVLMQFCSLFKHFFVRITGFQRIFLKLENGNYPKDSRVSCFLSPYYIQLSLAPKCIYFSKHLRQTLKIVQNCHCAFKLPYFILVLAIVFLDGHVILKGTGILKTIFPQNAPIFSNGLSLTQKFLSRQPKVLVRVTPG